MRRLKVLFLSLFCLAFQGALALLYFPRQFQFAKYLDAARQSLTHNLPPERLADLSPLYFYLHLLEARLAPSFPMLLVGQFLAMALAAAFLFFLLRRFVPPWLAGTGVAAFILNRSVITYAAIFEPEAFLLLFLLAFVHFSLQEGLPKRLLAGLCLALCLLTRPTFIPFLLLTPVWFFIQEGKQRWLRSSLAFLLLPAAALLLLSARNLSLHGNFTPVVMNPGYVFYEGNNPLSSGQSAVYPPLVGEMKTELAGLFDNPHVTYRVLARRISGHDLSITAVNSFWGQKALNFIGDYPGVFLKKMAEKAFFLLHSFHRYDLEVAYRFDQRLGRLWLPFVPFAPLAILGLFGLISDRVNWRQWLLPFLVVASQVGLMLVLYVSDRQRLPLVPFFILFSSVGIGRLLQWPGRLRYPAVAIMAAAAVFLSLPTVRMKDNLYLWEHFAASDNAWVEAVEQRDRGEWRQAAASAASSYAHAPWLADYSRPAFIPFGEDPEAFSRAALQLRQSAADGSPSDRFDRAVLMIDAGQWHAAEAILRSLLAEGSRFDRGYLQSSRPEYFLARLALLRGERTAAITLAQAALNASPGDPFALALLAALTGDTAYERKIADYYSEADAAVLVGMAMVEAGEPAAAAVRLSRGLQFLPELRRARIYLAAAWGAMGEERRAAALYEEATAERPDPVLLEQYILPLFRMLLQQSPDAPRASFRLGTVLAQYGHLEEALMLQEEALARTGDPLMVDSVRRLRRAVGRDYSPERALLP